MKNRILISIILIIIAASILGTFRLFQASSDGEITVILYNEETQISETIIPYEADDTLYELLASNFDITCMNASYEPDPDCDMASFSGISGRIILEIDALKSNWTDSYIEIEINGEKSSYGIDALNFTDQDVIGFRYTPLD